jgi:hypothetical protein
MVGVSLGWKIELRFSLWQNRLPMDALPVEGWMKLSVVTRQELENSIYNYSTSS